MENVGRNPSPSSFSLLEEFNLSHHWEVLSVPRKHLGAFLHSPSHLQTSKGESSPSHSSFSTFPSAFPSATKYRKFYFKDSHDWIVTEWTSGGGRGMIYYYRMDPPFSQGPLVLGLLCLPPGNYSS